jgi:hypothetical protein
MRLPPLPAEICKRRGITLAPIITKCFDETMSSEDFPHATQRHIHISPDSGQETYSWELEPENQEVSRWSTTTDSGSNYSKPEPETDFDHEESYEVRLKRYRHFFNNRPLMRCLDSSDDQLLADLLFERLLKEVQRPGLPFEESTRGARGEVQVRTYWDNVRKQLQIDDDFLRDEDRMESQGLNSGDGMKACLPIPSRGWRNTVIFKGEGGMIRLRNIEAGI